jgi:lactoylglutathione lyase
MVLNTRHTGIVVRDLEKAIIFYNLLGFKLQNRCIEEGPYIDKLVGLINARIEWAKLSLSDGSLLELLQYHSHPKNKDVKLQPANRLGCSHIALTVENISEAIKIIKTNGGIVDSEVQISPDGKVKVIYAFDTEGNILEIVEELN